MKEKNPIKKWMKFHKMVLLEILWIIKTVKTELKKKRKIPSKVLNMQFDEIEKVQYNKNLKQEIVLQLTSILGWSNNNSTIFISPFLTA